MAESKKPGWKRVARSFNRATDPRRKSAHVVVDISGLCITNVTAGEWILAKAVVNGQVPDQCNTAFDVNEEEGLVAVHMAKAGEKGATPALIDKKARRVSLHLGAVFAEFPALGATFPRKCPVHLDEDGTFIIALSAGVAHRSGQQAKQQAAPTTDQ